MNDWLLDIMKCPLSGEKLRVAEPGLVSKLRARQQAGDLHSHKGLPIQETFDGGLTNQSATYFYYIADNIPSLLPDEAIFLGGQD